MGRDVSGSSSTVCGFSASSRGWWGCGDGIGESGGEGEAGESGVCSVEVAWNVGIWMCLYGWDVGCAVISI